MKKRLKEVEAIRIEYNKITKEKSFNIFSALCRKDDEVRLHSRFIAYLLSHESEHGQGKKFAKEFINKVLKIKFDLDDYSVYPNESDKSERYNIDILLVDNKNKKAIIIENKTRYSTPDSNDDTKIEGYKGQLERYYNTIHKGKDSEGKEIEDKFHCENPYVFYLTVNKRKATEKSLGMLKGKAIVEYINYEDSIKQWLKYCIEVEEIEEVLKNVIMQYLGIVVKMTARVEENKKLKEIVSKYYSNKVKKVFTDTENLKQKHKECRDTIIYLNDKFNDIKWHTIDDFWIALRRKLVESEYESVNLSKSYISALNKISCGKNKPIGLHFRIKEEEKSFLYVAYDKYNGLTLGKIEKQENEEIKKWKKFEERSVSKVNFVEFENKETFVLIDNKKMKEVVAKIIDEIEKEQNLNFLNLKYKHEDV